MGDKKASKTGKASEKGKAKAARKACPCTLLGELGRLAAETASVAKVLDCHAKQLKVLGQMFQALRAAAAKKGAKKPAKKAAKKGGEMSGKGKQPSALLAQMEKVGKLYGDLQPGLRKDVLGLVADLKTRWLALGQKLNEVKRDMEYLQWGHGTWEGYREHELKMKATAADAMIDAYLWMSDHHPEVLKMQSPKWLPDMRAVAALSTTADKLLRDGWCDGERLDRLKEVEAQIMGGELDGAEARKAVREIVAKPKAEKKAAPSPRPSPQRDEDDSVPLWLAMDTVAEHAGESRDHLTHVLACVILPAARELLGIASSRIRKQLKPGEDLPGYETIANVMADTNGRLENLESCVQALVKWQAVDARILGEALAGVLEACDWEPEAAPAPAKKVLKKAKAAVAGEDER